MSSQQTQPRMQTSWIQHGPQTVPVSVSNWYHYMDMLVLQQFLELVCQAPKQSSRHQYIWHCEEFLSPSSKLGFANMKLPLSFGPYDKQALPKLTLWLCRHQTIYTAHSSLPKSTYSMATTEYSSKSFSTSQTQALSCLLSVCHMSVFPQFWIMKPRFQSRVPGPVSPVPASDKWSRMKWEGGLWKTSVEVMPQTVLEPGTGGLGGQGGGEENMTRWADNQLINRESMPIWRAPPHRSASWSRKLTWRRPFL